MKRGYKTRAVDGEIMTKGLKIHWLAREPIYIRFVQTTEVHEWFLFEVVVVSEFGGMESLCFQVGDHLRGNLRSQKEGDPSLRFVLERTSGERRCVAGPSELLILHPAVKWAQLPIHRYHYTFTGTGPASQEGGETLPASSGSKGEEEGERWSEHSQMHLPDTGKGSLMEGPPHPQVETCHSFDDLMSYWCYRMIIFERW